MEKELNKTKKKYRKHTESYISSKARIVVGEIISKEKRKSKYDEDYNYFRIKVANKLTDLFCRIDWGEEIGFRGYPHTQHYSFLGIDRNLFDFEGIGNDLEQGKIYIFKYYRDSGGYPLLISVQKTEGKKKHLEKLWEAQLAYQQRWAIELIEKAKSFSKN